MSQSKGRQDTSTAAQRPWLLRMASTVFSAVAWGPTNIHDEVKVQCVQWPLVQRHVAGKRPEMSSPWPCKSWKGNCKYETWFPREKRLMKWERSTTLRIHIAMSPNGEFSASTDDPMNQNLSTHQPGNTFYSKGHVCFLTFLSIKRFGRSREHLTIFQGSTERSFPGINQ